MSKKTKIFVAIVLGIAALIAAITFLGGSDSAEFTNTGISTSPAGVLSTSAIPFSPGALPSTVGVNEFSGLLSSISTISINTAIFQNPSYKALRDYPVVLGTDVVGRPNPFAPIGSDQLTTTALDVAVQTLAAGKITATSAEIGAVVTLPDTMSATVVFQYGTTDTFGSSTTPVTIAQTGTSLATISGLLPATKYFVQAVVVRGSGTTIGNVMTFTTTQQTAL